MKLGQQRGLFRLACEAVRTQPGQELIHLRAGFLYILLLPYRHDYLRKRLRVFQCGGAPLVTILLVQSLQRCATFVLILDQLNDGILFIVLLVQLSVDSSHTLGKPQHCVFVHGNICVRLTARLSPCDLGIHLLQHSIKAVCVCRCELILDFDGFPRIDEFLQANLILFRKVAVLALLEQFANLSVQRVQRFDVRRQLAGYGIVSGFVRRGLESLKLLASGSSQRLE